MKINVTDRPRIDWKTERDRIDLAAVATRLLGPASGRRGQSGRKLWWCCPFHEDRNPSFCVEPGKPWWKCFGCGDSGDAASLVMRLESKSFPEALDFLTDASAGSGKGPTRPAKAPSAKPPPEPSGLPEAAALALVEAAALALREGDESSRSFLVESAGKQPGPDPAPFLSDSGEKPSGGGPPFLVEIGEQPRPDRPYPFLSESLEKRTEAPSAREFADALAYLTGPDRGLSRATIQAARLGWTSRADGVAWNPPGVVIPWFVGSHLALVKIRPPEAWRERFPKSRRPPKYIEAFRHPGRLACYPDPAIVRPGRPLVIVEGEFDALALGEALGDLAAVVTLGSASADPAPSLVERFLPANPWFVATDADDAGDRSAARWGAYPRARRVRPPSPYKDWTEARQAGVDLARWWRDVLNARRLRPDARGDPAPELFTDEEAAPWRW